MEKNYTPRQINILVNDYKTNEEYQGDREITLLVLERDPMLLRYACDTLKDDDEVAKLAIGKNGQTLGFLSERLRMDVDMVKVSVYNHAQSYVHALSPARDDMSIIEQVAKSGLVDIIKSFSEDILDKPNIALMAIDRNPEAIQCFSEKVRATKEVVLAAIRKDRTTVRYISDNAFKCDEVLSLVVRNNHGTIATGVLNNNTPLALYQALYEKGIPIIVASQNINLLTIDRDKLLCILKVSTSIAQRKNDLFQKYIDEDDREIVSELLRLRVITPAKAYGVIEYASKNNKTKVLPVLLAYSRKGTRKKLNMTERDFLIKSLKRHSLSTYTKTVEKIEQYMEDDEIILYLCEINGVVIRKLIGTKYFNERKYVDACVDSYIVKNSDPAFLDGMDDLDITVKNAVRLCDKDERNYEFLSEEFE